MNRLAAAGCVACLVGGAACDSSPLSGEPFGSSPAWSAQLGGEGFQAPAAIAATRDGVVIGGVYTEELALGDRKLTGAGGLEGVVAAFDQSGTLRWIHELTGASGDDSIISLGGAPSGDVFVAGQASAGATFGGRTLAADGGSAALLAKLNANGEVAWIVTSRGAGFQAATAVAVAPDGAVYFAGDFSDDLDLGGGPMGTRSEGDAFVARFAPTGELEWVKAIVGAGPQHVEQLAVGPEGDATLVGHYVEELAIESEPATRNQLTNYTPFVARFRADGGLAWLQTRLLPPEFDHIGHDTAHHVGHPDVLVQDLRIGVAPSGTATVGITYGRAFGHGKDDFEAALVDNLTVTTIDADGNVTDRRTLTTPKAMLVLGEILAHDERTELSLSWTGQLTPLGDGSAFASDQHRSLALIDLTPDGSFVPTTTFKIPAVGLTSEGAVKDADGSLVLAVSWRDMYTLDRDIFLARFR